MHDSIATWSVLAIWFRFDATGFVRGLMAVAAVLLTVAAAVGPLPATAWWSATRATCVELYRATGLTVVTR